MELCITDCSSLIFFSIIVLLGTDTLESSTVSPCQSPQFAELGVEGVIRCNIEYQYHGFYWYMGNVRLDNNPAIRFEDNRKTGYGYPNEFDCTSDGSLVVKNVTLRHDNVFKILILRTDVEQRNVYEVNLFTTVTPDMEFPMITHNNKVASDYVQLNNNDSLACIVKAARPPSRTTWFKTVPQDGSVLISKEDIRLSTKNSSYDTSQTITFWSEEKFVLETFLCRSVGPGYERISQIVVDFDEDGTLLNSSGTKVINISKNDTVSISCVEHVTPTLVVWKKALQDRTHVSLALLSKGKVKKLANNSLEDFDVKLDGTLVIHNFQYRIRQNIYRCLFNDGLTTRGNTFQLLTGDSKNLTVTDGDTLNPEVHNARNVMIALLIVGIALLMMVVGIIVLLQRRRKVTKSVTKKDQDQTWNQNVEYISEKDIHESEEKDISKCEFPQDIKECIEMDEEKIPLFSTKIQDKSDHELPEQQEKKKVCEYNEEEDRYNPKPFQLFAERSEWKGFLTYQQFIEVTRNEMEYSADPTLDNMAFRFLSRVMACDNQAMTVFAKRPTLPTSHVVDENDDWYAAFCEAPDNGTESEDESNVLDLVLTLIIKCDMFLRQKVLEGMIACNLAVPVLLPLPDTDELFYLNWGLRSTTRFSTDTVSGGMNGEHVLSSRFPTVVFITLGQTTESGFSPCDMSNKVLTNFQENTQSYFFIEKDQESSRSMLFDGLLECVWLTPIKSAVCFDGASTKPVSFLNLRGNALDHTHTRQLKFVLPKAHVVIAYLQDSTIKEYYAKFNDIMSDGAYLCIISTSKDAIETGFQKDQNVQIFNVQELGEMSLASKLCYTIKELIENDAELTLRSSLDESFYETNNNINSEKDAVVECTNAEKVVRRIIEHADGKHELVKVFWEEAFKLKTCDYMLCWLELLLQEKYSIESLTRFLIDYFENSAGEERERIATMGARVLMSGRPLELVRGDTDRVPIDWLEKVLEEITKLFEIQNARLFVTSAIGIQRSGKSSLLNTLFKTCFPVRSGKGNKGMQFQILKMNGSQREMLQCDFIAVIDTEGIQEPDLEPIERPQRELALTAFAMLISDLVLLNVAGETMENKTANVFVSATQMIEVITDHKVLTRITHQLISDPKAKQLQTAEINYLRKRLEKRDKNNITVENKVVIDEDSYYFPPFWVDNNLSKNTDFCEVGFHLKESLLNIVEGTMNYSDIDGFVKRISVANDRFIKTT